MNFKTHVPFFKGNMYRSARDLKWYCRPHEIDWREAKSFIAKLKFDDFSFGTSARLVELRHDVTCERYIMQLRHWKQHIPKLVDGKLFGKFIFKKGGQYWNVELVDSSPIEQLALAALDSLDEEEDDE